MTTFFVPGVPRPKARPRVVAGHAYTPRGTREWEQLVRMHYHGPLYEGDVAVRMTFLMPTRRRVDLDNLAKACADALNKKAYHDDGQIVRMELARIVDRDNPGVQICIEEAT